MDCDSASELAMRAGGMFLARERDVPVSWLYASRGLGESEEVADARHADDL